MDCTALVSTGKHWDQPLALASTEHTCLHFLTLRWSRTTTATLRFTRHVIYHERTFAYTNVRSEKMHGKNIPHPLHDTGAKIQTLKVSERSYLESVYNITWNILQLRVGKALCPDDLMLEIEN
jgi:hypothetical protein